MNLAILPLLPQPRPLAVLTINVRDQVDYQADTCDVALFATVPGITHPNTPRNFFVVTIIADIIAVNGSPAKGTYFGRTRPVVSSPVPVPGGAIADVTRNAMREHFFEILNTDGTEVGTIMSTGFSGGVAPPGTGLPVGERGNWAIVGGTGAYLGARGQAAAIGVSTERAASMTEDPGNRRINHGGLNEFVLHLIPMDPPQILTTPEGPLIFHSNAIPVTVVTPAVAGEVLTLVATGLGPTHPDVDLTQPFPASPPSSVNAPVTITVNGVAAEVESAVGFPGAVNAYQVSFKIPANTVAGSVPIQLTAAWIAAPSVNISIH